MVDNRPALVDVMGRLPCAFCDIRVGQVSHTNVRDCFRCCMIREGTDGFP
jgi:hypothetical protein